MMHKRAGSKDPARFLVHRVGTPSSDALIARMLGRLERVLEQVAEETGRPLAELELDGQAVRCLGNTSFRNRLCKGTSC
jgi:hypothetical protein